MQKKLMIYLFMVMSFFLFSDQLRAEYGHISYIEPDSQIFVERLNGKKDKGILNLPIIAGDKIISAGKSRCEIQFNNGTLIRLDHNSILKIITIKAQTLTTKKSISTIELSEGALYIMANVYNKEIFQIKTENSAALFNKFSTAIIQYKNKNTDFNVFRGKINIIYGVDIKTIKNGRIKSKNAYTVNSDNVLIKNVKTLHKDFLAWNTDINKNFDKLHKGKSKVPKPVYRFSKGIIKWAEEWSSAYGKWVYDDIYGYVWSPYDESFAYDKRPFFGAEFKVINDKLYLIPSQKWGWAPSQLGTWVFMKKSGWVWIPGDAFNGGRTFPFAAKYAMYSSRFHNVDWFEWYAHSGIHYWIDKQYGDLQLYYKYREDGKRAWAKEYKKKYGPISKKKIKMPAHIKKIISKMNRSYISRLKKSISQPKIIKKNNMRYKFAKAPLLKPIDVGSRTNTLQKLKTPGKFNKSVSKIIKNKLTKINFKDFNPDTKWAIQKNVNIRYFSKTNSVVCDNLKVYRKFLKNHPKQKSHSAYKGGSSYSRSSSGGSTSSQSSSGGSAIKRK